MRYKDKATIKQVTNHQNKPESIYYGQNMTNRQKQRIRKHWLSNFRLKVTDKTWWDSLKENEKTEIATEYKQTKEGNNLKELMILYPGNKSYIRDAKLNELGI
jgi:TRAP-type C4-dicarboxylate transport system substrate-binding protein